MQRNNLQTEEKALSFQEPDSILVLDPCNLEEAVLSTPAYAAISFRFPNATLGLVTTEQNALLLRGDPHFSSITGIPPSQNFFDLFKTNWLKLVQKLRDNHYDMAIVLSNDQAMARLATLLGIPVRVGTQADRRSRLFLNHPVELSVKPDGPLEKKLALLDKMGCVTRRRKPVLVPSSGDEKYILDLLSGTSLSRKDHFLLFSPGESWQDSVPAPVLAQVIDEFSEMHPDAATFIAGSISIREYINEMLSLSRNKPSVIYLSPNHFLAFSSVCDLVVGAEGLHSTIAIAAGARVIGVYGSLNTNRGDDSKEAVYQVQTDSMLKLIESEFSFQEKSSKRALKRRFYESEEYRSTHGDANLFLRTAP